MALAIVVVTDVTFVRNTKKMVENEDKIRPLKQNKNGFKLDQISP